MKKSVRTIQLISFILIFLQILALVIFCLFYFTDFQHLQDRVLAWHFILVACNIVILDSFFIWIITIILSTLRKKSDLQAAEVIGGDVQEAYNFGMIGLLVTNEKNTILWANDLFKERHIDVIDRDILEWEPRLRELSDARNVEKTQKVDIFSRKYEVKLLPDAGLWIFKDITELEDALRINEERSMVIGLLTIDNFEDAIHGEEDYSDTATKVKSLIFNYAKEHSVLLRRIKNETYSVLCTYSNFLEMKKDNFSLIDAVRQVSYGEDIPLTLSIGFAYNFPDVVKLSELANNALDVALSRGGDQVVVTCYGKEMEFYGGKTEAQEKRNKVHIRTLADSLRSLIDSSGNVLVMGHKYMDMDSLGACLGIKAICDNLNKNCHMVVDYKLTEIKTRSAILTNFNKNELQNLVVFPKDASNLVSPNTLLVVVDVHTPNMVMDSKLLEECSKIVVIDHHRRAEDYIESPVFNYIDPAASSACELITEFIYFSSVVPKIDLPAKFATIMLSGIFLDSSYFKSKSTGIRTFEASTILKEYGANNSEADDLLKDDYEEYLDINTIVKNMKTPEYGVVYAFGLDNRNYDQTTIAKAANTLLTLKDIHAVFAFARTTANEIRMSCRSNGKVNVQLLAEKLGGGGHFVASAVTFTNLTYADVEAKLLEVLKQNLASATTDDPNDKKRE